MQKGHKTDSKHWNLPNGNFRAPKNEHQAPEPQCRAEVVTEAISGSLSKRLTVTIAVQIGLVSSLSLVSNELLRHMISGRWWYEHRIRIQTLLAGVHFCAGRGFTSFRAPESGFFCREHVRTLWSLGSFYPIFSPINRLPTLSTDSFPSPPEKLISISPQPTLSIFSSISSLRDGNQCTNSNRVVSSSRILSNWVEGKPLAVDLAPAWGVAYEENSWSEL